MNEWYEENKFDVVVLVVVKVGGIYVNDFYLVDFLLENFRI